MNYMRYTGNVVLQFPNTHEQAMQTVEEVGEVLGQDVLGDSVENDELERELQALLSTAQTNQESATTQDVTQQLAKLQLTCRPMKRPDASCQPDQGTVTSDKDDRNRQRHKPLPV